MIFTFLGELLFWPTAPCDMGLPGVDWCYHIHYDMACYVRHIMMPITSAGRMTRIKLPLSLSSSSHFLFTLKNRNFSNLGFHVSWFTLAQMGACNWFISNSLCKRGLVQDYIMVQISINLGWIFLSSHYIFFEKGKVLGRWGILLAIKIIAITHILKYI